MRLLYSFAIQAYHYAVALAAFFGNHKAKLWIKGRRSLPQSSPDKSKWIWFHVSSLGEFEQGRPVIELLKRNHPDIKILLSFFSPSGYEIRKNYNLADEILYLPTDTMKNAKRWIGRHNFIAACFVKYDFWFNYIKCLYDNGIPLYYISVTMSQKNLFFKWYGTWFKRQLQLVTHFYVQDTKTEQLLNDNGINQVTTCGDTRFDRVADIAKCAERFTDIEIFINGRKCIIAGSTWPPDEQLIAKWLPNMPHDHCLIIAPHDISETHIRQILLQFKNAKLYSEKPTQGNILVINTIGILSQLYQYAEFAYIGGAFGSGLHNTQEAIIFGCPVVFGPKYKKFIEAVDLVKLKGAFSVNTQAEFNEIFTRMINDKTLHESASKTCREYTLSKLGATKLIANSIEQQINS